jgi:hypothetical protein
MGGSGSGAEHPSSTPPVVRRVTLLIIRHARPHLPHFLSLSYVLARRVSEGGEEEGSRTTDHMMERPSAARAAAPAILQRAHQSRLPAAGVGVGCLWRRHASRRWTNAKAASVRDAVQRDRARGCAGQGIECHAPTRPLSLDIADCPCRSEGRSGAAPAARADG